MDENIETPQVEEPQKNRTLIIVIAVVVALCCCCLIAVALAWQFGDSVFLGLG